MAFAIPSNYCGVTALGSALHREASLLGNKVARMISHVDPAISQMDGVVVAAKTEQRSNDEVSRGGSQIDGPNSGAFLPSAGSPTYCRSVPYYLPAVQCSTVQYRTVQYRTVQYRTVQYRTVLGLHSESSRWP
jgi:hypothetical protein